MFYTPKKEKLWDCWLVPNEGKYYLFYIRVSDGGKRWDGISLAVSDDLLHWREIGTVITKDEDAIWLGTGMVQRIGDRFIMNYSQEKPERYGKIYFAESSDLLTWRRIEDAISEPDPHYYMYDPRDTCDHMPRWDSIGILNALEKEKKPPYYAFCTCNIAKPEESQRSGVLGLLTSNDGINWQCLPPAVDDGSLFPSYEVPDPFILNGRYYVLFCCSSYLGFRYDAGAETMCGGTYYVVADNPQGPYRLPECDPMIQGVRDHSNVCMNYVGRVIKQGNDYLYYHIWGDPNAVGWFGPLKLLVEKSPGQLQLLYWKGNEKLKGRELSLEFYDSEFEQVKQIGIQRSVEWKCKKNVIEFTGKGSSNAIMWKKDIIFTPVPSLLSDGRIIEFKQVIMKGNGAGIVIGTASGEKFCIFLSCKKNRVEFSWIKQGWGSNLVLSKEVYSDCSLKYNSSINVKILVRHMFIELYIDGIYVNGIRITEDFDLNYLGFYSEDSYGTFSDMKIWQME